MWNEVNLQGEGKKMIDGDFRFAYVIASRDTGLSLSIMQIVNDLRTFAGALQNKVDELERDPPPNQELIQQERTILDTTRKEIQRLERKAPYLELDS